MLKLEINTREELIAVIADLQGQMATMEETINKLSPVEEEVVEEVAEETTEEMSDEEINEIDQMLQEN